jgi:hypothetical protein
LGLKQHGYPTDTKHPITKLRLFKPVVWLYQPIPWPSTDLNFQGGFLGHFNKFDSRLASSSSTRSYEALASLAPQDEVFGVKTSYLAVAMAASASAGALANANGNRSAARLGARAALMVLATVSVVLPATAKMPVPLSVTFRFVVKLAVVARVPPLKLSPPEAAPSGGPAEGAGDEADEGDADLDRRQHSARLARHVERHFGAARTVARHVFQQRSAG